MNIVLHIICTAFERVLTVQTLINSFMVQTNPNWRLYIIHDGVPPQKMTKMVSEYNDPRIVFRYTPEVNGFWGHINRGLILSELKGKANDYILITNDDNYYVPVFVEYMLKGVLADTGIVYCDTIHSYFKYTVHISELRNAKIDMGAFIVKYPIAKKVGFTDTNRGANGLYAEKCVAFCLTKGLKNVYIGKPLFIHN